jgi:chemosensory pili system protein ChpC
MIDKTIIRSLLIPLNGGQLLLPIAAVAEVTPYHKPETVATSSPDWLLGVVHWRNHSVPLVSIEKLLSLSTVIPTTKHRLVVFYGLESTQLPFYAIVAAEVPRVINLSESSLSNPGVETRPGLVFSAIINNRETVWLPDLGYLENLLRKTPAT